MSDIIYNYKPITVKTNRFYKSSIETNNILYNLVDSQLSDFEESLLNPFDFIDSKYFNTSHIEPQSSLVLDFDNESFSTYMILYRLITKYNIKSISMDNKPKYIDKLLEYKSHLKLDERTNNSKDINDSKDINRYDVYCVNIDTILNPDFWKDKNGSSIVIKVDPKQHTPKLLKILNSILSLSTNSYIEIPINHCPVYYIVALYLHQNFHHLYTSLKEIENDNIKINTIFNKAMNVLNETKKLKNNYKGYEWTSESSEYVLSLNLNYCYSICKSYNLKLNPAYLNQFNQLKEIKLNHSKYIIKYFPYEPYIFRSYLQTTNVGLYSITKPFVTSEIIKIMDYQIRKKFNVGLKDMVITDGTGGVGGDAIMFTKHFKFTNVVEIVKTHYDIIRNNLKIYKRKNYKLYCQNYMDIYDQLEQDVIYLDSPWGGIGYKNQKQTDLYLFDTNISFNDFVDTLTNNNSKNEKNNTIIFIKCPINYNIFELSKNIKYRIEVFNVSNFLLLALI